VNGRTPPKLAAWLLDKLGYLRHSPALFGDLLEEYHSGRSKAWYWRQTAGLIATGTRAKASEALLREFAILFAAQALLDWLLWRVRGVVLRDAFRRVPVLMEYATTELKWVEPGTSWMVRRGLAHPGVIKRSGPEALFGFIIVSPFHVVFGQRCKKRSCRVRERTFEPCVQPGLQSIYGNGSHLWRGTLVFARLRGQQTVLGTNRNERRAFRQLSEK
jgi:hypothetical protein